MECSLFFSLPTKANPSGPSWRPDGPHSSSLLSFLWVQNMYLFVNCVFFGEKSLALISCIANELSVVKVRVTTLKRQHSKDMRFGIWRQTWCYSCLWHSLIGWIANNLTLLGLHFCNCQMKTVVLPESQDTSVGDEFKDGFKRSGRSIHLLSPKDPSLGPCPGPDMK